MTSEALEAKLQKQWAFALDNSSRPPWVVQDFSPAIRLYYVPAKLQSGEYLMRLNTVPKFHGSAMSMQVPHPRVWMGLLEEDHATIAHEINAWMRALEPGLSARLGGLNVIVGSDLRGVTSHLHDDPAFVAPRIGPGGKLEFLVCVSYPRAKCDRPAEIRWLNSAVSHELSHVWQFLASGSASLEQPWKPAAEMCAVYTELVRYPDRNAVMDFGAEFLRSLPEGLLTGSLPNHDGHPWWGFPFFDYLEKFAPGVYRELWKEKGRQSGEADCGPWVCLDRLLRQHGTTLPQTWNDFCRLAIKRERGVFPLLDQIEERFPPRFPTQYLDLTDPDDACGGGLWESWPLSAHWVSVRPHPERAWKFKWMFTQLRGNVQMTVSFFPPGGPWEKVAGHQEDGEEHIILPAGDSPLELLFVHACVPDMSNQYPRSVGAAQVTFECEPA